MMKTPGVWMAAAAAPDGFGRVARRVQMCLGGAAPTCQGVRGDSSSLKAQRSRPAGKAQVSRLPN
jgi:hypothetical protein